MTISTFLRKMFGAKPAEQPAPRAMGYAVTLFSDPSRVVATGLTLTHAWQRAGRCDGLSAWICTQAVMDDPDADCVVRDGILDVKDPDDV